MRVCNAEKKPLEQCPLCIVFMGDQYTNLSSSVDFCIKKSKGRMKYQITMVWLGNSDNWFPISYLYCNYHIQHLLPL